jgi:hypothetical protein
MLYSRHTLIITALLLLVALSTEGQRRKAPRLWEGFRVIPKAGVNIFYGDLVDESRTKYSFGVAADKEIKPHLSLRAQIMGGAMKGTQMYGNSDQVYAYFDNSYFDFTVGASFRPLELMYGYFKQRSVSPYLFLQTGIVGFNATEYYGPMGLVPNTKWRETGFKISPVISGGLGASFRINSLWSVVGEFTGYLPFTDLMDGHEEWTSGSGTVYQTDDSDFYYTATLGVSYLIKDSKWRNHPKYNRKAYQKTRREYSSGTKKKSAAKYKRRR